MKKPTQSVVRLLNSERFKSGKGSAQELVSLLREQDTILHEMQEEAIDVVKKDIKYREVVEPHWYNLAKLRVDFIGCVEDCRVNWPDGGCWAYPEEIMLPN